MSGFFGSNIRNFAGGGFFNRSPGGTPVYHPVYSLDGLGAGDPADVALNFGAGSATANLTYTPPSDGNQHRGALITLVALDATEVTTIDATFESAADVASVDDIIDPSGGGAGFIFARYGVIFLGGVTGTNWTFTRTGPTLNAAQFTARIYTFGDYGENFTRTNQDSYDITATPNPVVILNLVSGFVSGDLKGGFGARNQNGASAFRITTPNDYTYSPTGSAGNGRLANPQGSAANGLALEFKNFTTSDPGPVAVQDQWLFTTPGAAELGALSSFTLGGATY